MRVVSSCLLCVMCVLAAPGTLRGAREQGVPTLRVAVVITPDVLLADLLPQFEQEQNVRVQLLINDNAFNVARNGGADLVIAHYGHPMTEGFITGGFGRWPRFVFANQSAFIGPTRDPVGARGLTDVVEAFRLMVRRGGEFIVNNAPTERYLAEIVWEAAGRPDRNGWWLDLGLREQPAVEAAAQRGAYTFWGVVPFVRFNQPRSRGLEALVIDDPLLQRGMIAVVVNSARVSGVDEARATALQQFLIEPRTQARIRQFRHHGLPASTWWPVGRFNSAPNLSVP